MQLSSDTLPSTMTTSNSGPSRRPSKLADIKDACRPLQSLPGNAAFEFPG